MVTKASLKKNLTIFAMLSINSKVESMEGKDLGVCTAN